MDQNAITVSRSTALVASEQQIGDLADEYARQNAFEDYASRKADSTLAAQRTDLKTFVDFLGTVGIERDATSLQSRPAGWQPITHGLIAAFVRWMLHEGYSIATVNRRLSTVKVYAGLAARAGIIDTESYAMIRMVKAYDSTEGKRIDERRPQSRRSRQKAATTTITVQQAQAFKKWHDYDPKGRRDALIMCLLVDHGLRVSELISLKVGDFDMERHTFEVYRSKVDIVQTHKLTRDTLATLAAYINAGDASTDPDAPILRKSRKGGTLSDPGMTRQSVFRLVQKLGYEEGIDSLSPHDLRHYWATYAVELGTSAFALRDAGGWKSLAMPSRYVEQSEIANDGVMIR